MSCPESKSPYRKIIVLGIFALISVVLVCACLVIFGTMNRERQASQSEPQSDQLQPQQFQTATPEAAPAPSAEIQITENYTIAQTIENLRLMIDEYDTGIKTLSETVVLADFENQNWTLLVTAQHGLLVEVADILEQSIAPAEISESYALVLEGIRACSLTLIGLQMAVDSKNVEPLNKFPTNINPCVTKYRAGNQQMRDMLARLRDGG